MINKSFQLCYMMADSGARGSKQQIRQLGWYAWSDGETRRPDYRNPDYCELVKGLNVLSVQYFISTTVRVKVWPMTALKTANSVYLTSSFGRRYARPRGDRRRFAVHPTVR